MSQVIEAIRPTKKQKELLTFIEVFIAEHGYSPSYREIMAGQGYAAVATVALHVNSLIKRGHLRKRDHSARSLEVVKQSYDSPAIRTNVVKPSEEKWLIDKVDYYFNRVEGSSPLEQRDIDELYVLVGALKVLGLDGAAQAVMPRLTALKKRLP